MGKMGTVVMSRQNGNKYYISNQLYLSASLTCSLAGRSVAPVNIQKTLLELGFLDQQLANLNAYTYPKFLVYIYITNALDREENLDSCSHISCQGTGLENQIPRVIFCMLDGATLLSSQGQVDISIIFLFYLMSILIKSIFEHVQLTSSIGQTSKGNSGLQTANKANKPAMAIRTPSNTAKVGHFLNL